MLPGFRRRILIEPAPGRTTAQLEDDYHRMVVTLDHADGVITAVHSEMVRSPWSTCEGAMARVQETFNCVALADVVRRGERLTNCTHLHDLAVFAATHADEAAPVAYDVHITDAIDGRRESRLVRNGVALLRWEFDGSVFVAPAELAGRTLAQIGDWIAAQDRAGAEAGRILRWATMISGGRVTDMPAGMSATAFPLGTCYTFQPDVARIATRKAGADVDFSQPGMEPLAERAEMFGAFPETTA